MSAETKAIIRWIPADRGGRSSPPLDAAGYSSPIRFETDPQFDRGAWSIRLSHVLPLRGAECILATIELLVPDAPRELMRAGERFELLEGKKTIAKGVILPQLVKIPSQLNDFEV